MARQYKVSNGDLLGRSRSKTIALARQVAMYLLIYELELSPTEVGRLAGQPGPLDGDSRSRQD